MVFLVSIESSRDENHIRVKLENVWQDFGSDHDSDFEENVDEETARPCSISDTIITDSSDTEAASEARFCEEVHAGPPPLQPVETLQMPLKPLV